MNYNNDDDDDEVIMYCQDKSRVDIWGKWHSGKSRNEVASIDTHNPKKKKTTLEFWKEIGGEIRIDENCVF